MCRFKASYGSNPVINNSLFGVVFPQESMGISLDDARPYLFNIIGGPVDIDAIADTTVLSPKEHVQPRSDHKVV